MSKDEALRQATKAMRETLDVFDATVYRHAYDDELRSMAHLRAAVLAAEAALAAPTAEPRRWQPCVNCAMDSTGKITHSIGCPNDPSVFKAAPADEPVATYSPCCHMLREGMQPAEVMHDGLCRGKHGGELGPTVLLYANPVARKPLRVSQIVRLAHRFELGACDQSQTTAFARAVERAHGIE